MKDPSNDSSFEGEDEGLPTRPVYYQPEFSVAPLRLVTLGGTMGNGDSGDNNNQAPPGPGPAASFEGDITPMPQDPDR